MQIRAEIREHSAIAESFPLAPASTGEAGGAGLQGDLVVGAALTGLELVWAEQGVPRRWLVEKTLPFALLVVDLGAAEEAPGTDHPGRLWVAAQVPEDELVWRSGGEGGQGGAEVRLTAGAAVESWVRVGGQARGVVRFRTTVTTLQPGQEPVVTAHATEVPVQARRPAPPRPATAAPRAGGTEPAEPPATTTWVEVARRQEVGGVVHRCFAQTAGGAAPA